MLILFVALIGAVTNKIRGGILTDLFKRKVLFVKPLHDTLYASLFICILKGGFLYISDLSYIDFAVFFTLYISMLAGRSKGWGNYIGGIIFRRIYDQEEVKWIDELVMNNNNYPVTRSVIALSLRGLMWTCSLAFGFHLCHLLGFYVGNVIWIIPVGLLMGPVYLLTTEICDRVSERANGWTWGELVWGGVLWGSCAWLVI